MCRVERIEKGKSADVAGLKIGDLIIAVNGEDVTTVPNTTIYTKMK
jgi:C-terminal processing protease CtpA/Prc